MRAMVIAVGSTRPPKANAVSEAIRQIAPLLDPNVVFSVVAKDVPSGVGHTPTSRAELMAGARGRCDALQQLAREGGERWQYFVGLEGGLDVVHENGRRLVFLESWAMVRDAEGREAYGQAGGILLPDALAAEVLDRGVELSIAIDAFASGQGIRDRQGAWGVLTRDLITRQDAFRIAVIQAFAPFFNAQLYSRR